MTTESSPNMFGITFLDPIVRALRGLIVEPAMSEIAAVWRSQPRAVKELGRQDSKRRRYAPVNSASGFIEFRSLATAGHG